MEPVFTTIRTPQDGIDEVDRIRREQGISQMEISRLADMPDVGQQYYRMYKRKDCRLSIFLRLLQAEGYDMIIVRRE